MLHCILQPYLGVLRAFTKSKLLSILGCLLLECDTLVSCILVVYTYHCNIKQYIETGGTYRENKKCIFQFLI